MPRTQTSIANMAADMLDGSPIGDITDNFGEAIIYARNYDEAVETVITEFTWNRATARAVLSAAVLPDAFTLTDTDLPLAWALPADCIEPVDINGRPVEDIRWEVETVADVNQFGVVTGRRRVLLTSDLDACVLRYKCLIAPGDMSPHLAKAVAIELAQRCCMKITNSSSKLEQLRAMYEEATQGTRARRGGFQTDSRANRPQKPRAVASTGQRARHGGDM